MKLADRILVVTGAGSGLGRAVVVEALRRGARVAAVDVNPETLRETASLVPGDAALSRHVVDVTDREAVGALPGQVRERFGAVDGLVHCAGVIQPFVRTADLDQAAVERVFAINWWGTYHLARAFLPVLRARPEGHLVNVSSMGGFLPVPGQTVYGASKAAVKIFTGDCAPVRGYERHVTTVIPGDRQQHHDQLGCRHAGERRPGGRADLLAHHPGRAACRICAGMGQRLPGLIEGREGHGPAVPSPRGPPPGSSPGP